MEKRDNHSKDHVEYKAAWTKSDVPFAKIIADATDLREGGREAEAPPPKPAKINKIVETNVQYKEFV